MSAALLKKEIEKIIDELPEDTLLEVFDYLKQLSEKLVLKQKKDIRKRKKGK